MHPFASKQQSRLDKTVNLDMSYQFFPFSTLGSKKKAAIPHKLFLYEDRASRTIFYDLGNLIANFYNYLNFILILLENQTVFKVVNSQEAIIFQGSKVIDSDVWNELVFI